MSVCERERVSVCVCVCVCVHLAELLLQERVDQGAALLAGCADDQVRGRHCCSAVRGCQPARFAVGRRGGGAERCCVAPEIEEV